MNFNSKEELIEFVKTQCGVVLPNESGFLNEDEYLLYTEIPRTNKIEILSLLDKYGIRHNEHLKNRYWIYLLN